MIDDRFAALAARCGLDDDASFADVVRAIAALPYGRPKPRTPAGVVACGRGTCSTKHALLAEIAAARYPERAVELVLRAYRVTPESAGALFGPAAAAAVPPGGLVDVHLYATALAGGRRVRIDATFPGEPWDGASDMPLACGPGDDVPAGARPLETKAAVERERCDPAAREPFIAALGDR